LIPGIVKFLFPFLHRQLGYGINNYRSLIPYDQMAGM